MTSSPPSSYTVKFEPSDTCAIVSTTSVPPDKMRIRIVCFNVNTECKYPFIQYLLTTIPAITAERALDEKEDTPDPSARFFLPELKGYSGSIDELLAYISLLLLHTSMVSPSSYRGYFVQENCAYALFDITSHIDVRYMERVDKLSKFALALQTEIINKKRIVYTPIDASVIFSFETNPRMVVLYNPETTAVYPAPDVGYIATSLMKDAKFQNIFGLSHGWLHKWGIHAPFYVAYREPEYAQSELTFGDPVIIARHAYFALCPLIHEVGNVLVADDYCKIVAELAKSLLPTEQTAASEMMPRPIYDGAVLVQTPSSIPKHSFADIILVSYDQHTPIDFIRLSAATL